MEKKSRKPRPRMEDLIPDEVRRKEVISRLYQGDPILGEGGVFTDMLQAFVNAALEGEIDENMRSSKAKGDENRRNGHTRKTVRTGAGPITVNTPRDREGIHEPLLVKKWERDLGTGVDDIILSLYARGQSVEDVKFQLQKIYGIEVSAGVISSVTDRVIPEIIEWQQRPLAPCYPIIYLDAIHYKVREMGQMSSKAVYSCYSIGVDGQRDILGLYLDESEGARNWGLILEDLKNRGVEDVFFFCIDGLTGFKEVIENVYPQAIVQRCIVHMVRNSVRFVSDRDIKEVCSDLRKVYKSANRAQAELALESFGLKWDKKYKEITMKWKANWDELMAFMDYEPNTRRMIYTTNPVEALHRVMRKVTKSKGAWSNDKGLLKQLFLALKYNEKSWKKNAFNWVPVQREFVEKYGTRFEKYL